MTDVDIAAAATARRNDFVIEALALKAAIPEVIVRRILEARSGKAITALVWKAGCSMRTALEVQKTVGHDRPGRSGAGPQRGRLSNGRRRTALASAVF